MGFSNIAAQQREKAAETLKSFLALGLIGSVGLHIGVLGFGIGNFLDKVSPLKDEPMELTLIEPPSLEIEKPVGETQEKSPPSSSSNETPRVVSAPSSIAIAPSVVTQKPPQPLRNIPKKQVVENSKTPLPQQKPIQTPKEIARPQPAPVAKITASSKVPAAPEVVAASPTVPSSVAPERSQNNQKLRDLLATTRNTQQKTNNISANSKPNALGLRQASNSNNLPNRSGNGAVNSTASGSRIVTGNTPGTSTNITTGNSTVGTSRVNSSTSGSRIGIGNKPSNSSANGSRIRTNSGSGSNVATGAQNVRPRNAQPESSNNSNSRSGGLACRTCSKPKYPDKARRRGLEGKAEINVDVDSKGNVTNVRLANSSGHSELDKAAMDEARRWKFKAPSGGKRSVSAKVDFAIEGSERSRKVRERRKRRQAESRRTPIENARSQPVTETTAPTPTRRIRQRQNPASSPLPSQTATSSRRRIEIPPRRSQETVPPRRRARASTRRSLQQAPLTNQTVLRQSLRRQRQTSSQTKLRQSLRQLKQSQPTDNPND